VTVSGRNENGTRKQLLILVFLVAAIMVTHYSIPPDALIYHDMLRRSMYVPIILGAVWFGTAGGVGVALAASLFYAPHLFLQQRLPSADEIDSAVEMFLYVIVGGLTGLLVERERWQRRQTEEALVRLQDTHAELRQQTEQLRDVQEGLQQVERLSTLGELAADLAHEVRNPLAALRGTVQILAREFPPEHHKHEFAEIVIQELDRLDGVVEGYLRTARSRSVRGGESDAVAVLDTVIQLIQPRAQRAGVAVEHHAPDHLPLAMNAAQLTQVFMNIALNAIQAMPQGGALRIDCRRVSASDGELRQAEITFVDNGPGVAPENREKIFQPFFTTKATGTGLGLSIARRLVDEHGGKLALEVSPGSGSVFRLHLPLAEQ
jgi:two-component system sensor histidine kinase HydH